MRDHGGDLDRAKAQYGGEDWIDLSTGINPVAYPMPPIEAHAFAALPTREDISALTTAAARAYGTCADVVALAGAQAAIQLVPRLMSPGTARVLTPTYNEHAASLHAQGWSVAQVTQLSDLRGAELGVVVNPNNPDGRCWSPEELVELSQSVGLLVVDESFADPHPEVSLAPELHRHGERLLVLRSFGKFYGLAGLRLGFAIGGAQATETLRALAGPWAVSGPAIALARQALADTGWQNDTRRRLATDSAQLDLMAQAAGWELIGGTALFRTYATPNAAQAQAELARAGIWTRIFPYSPHWLRMGLPGCAPDWARLEAALTRSGH